MNLRKGMIGILLGASMLLGGMPVSALDLDQGDASQIQPAYVGVTSISPKLSINTSGCLLYTSDAADE